MVIKFDLNDKPNRGTTMLMDDCCTFHFVI